MVPLVGASPTVINAAAPMGNRAAPLTCAFNLWWSNWTKRSESFWDNWGR